MAPLGIMPRFEPIGSVGVDIRPPQGDEPPDVAADYFDSTPYASSVARGWGEFSFAWEASGLYHLPLYFEDVPLERYGHTICPCAQPAISAAHFFATVPMLPYKMCLEPFRERVHALGYYRPGSRAPRLVYPFPLRLDAAAVQGGAVTGLIFVIP